MKRSYLTLALLCSCFSIDIFSHAIVLKTPLLESLDGQPVVRIDRIVALAHRIDQMIAHNYGKDGSHITLDDLVHFTHDQEVDRAKMERFLRSCVSNFVRIMEEDGYIRDFRIIYPIFQELLEAWVKQRNKYQSPFYKFGAMIKDSTIDLEILMPILTSLQVYQTCLLDCKEFLGDVLTSLPKSHALYLEAIAKNGATK